MPRTARGDHRKGATARRSEELGLLITKSFEESGGAYGYGWRRIWPAGASRPAPNWSLRSAGSRRPGGDVSAAPIRVAP